MSEQPKLGQLEEAIKSKEWNVYSREVQDAFQHLLAALSGTNQPNWIDHKHAVALQEIVNQVKAERWPRVFSTRVDKFLETYWNLVAEFPQLQSEAYEQGKDDIQHD